MYFQNGGYYLSAITRVTICQRYPYRVRLSKHFSVDLTLIVGRYRKEARHLVVGRQQAVVIPGRRIRAVKQLLRS